MDDLVAILALAAVLAAAAWLVTANPWLPVAQTVVVPGVPPARLDDPVLLLLANLPGSEVIRSRPDTFSLRLSRRPGWIWIPLVLTFPLGLLFLLVKQTGSLEVSVAPSGSGSEVRLVGRTTQSVVRTLAKALGSLGAEVSDR